MSANLIRLEKEGEKRIRQLEHIKAKFGKLKRDDLIAYSPLTYVRDTEKDINRIRSNMEIAASVYDASGMLDDDKTERFCNLFRAIVVYREVLCEMRQLLDGTFGINLGYLFLNPEKKNDTETELAYLTEHPEQIDDYMRRQRERLRATQIYKYVSIDETVPFGL